MHDTPASLLRVPRRALCLASPWHTSLARSPFIWREAELSRIVVRDALIHPPRIAAHLCMERKELLLYAALLLGIASFCLHLRPSLSEPALALRSSLVAGSSDLRRSLAQTSDEQDVVVLKGMVQALSRTLIKFQSSEEQRVRYEGNSGAPREPPCADSAPLSSGSWLVVFRCPPALPAHQPMAAAAPEPARHHGRAHVHDGQPAVPPGRSLDEHSARHGACALARSAA